MFRALAIVLALLALASLPCLIAWLVIGIDRITDGIVAFFGRLRPGRRTPVPRSRPIERIAADLHRLYAARLDPAPRSAIRQQALQQAYDETLQEACLALALEHHFDKLSGMDREIERLRVEGELESAGLVLQVPGVRRREWH